MLLVLDVGNTKTAIGVYGEGEWIADWRVTTHLDHLSDEYYVLLKSLLEDRGLAWKDISGAIIASVVPPLTATFQELMERVLDEVSFDATDKGGSTVKIDAKYVEKNVGDLAKNADLSKFIL